MIFLQYGLKLDSTSFVKILPGLFRSTIWASCGVLCWLSFFDGWGYWYFDYFGASFH